MILRTMYSFSFGPRSVYSFSKLSILTLFQAYEPPEVFNYVCHPPHRVRLADDEEVMERLGNPRSVRIFDIVTYSNAPKWVFQRTDRAFPIAAKSTSVLIRAVDIDLDLDPAACPKLDEEVSALLEAALSSSLPLAPLPSLSYSSTSVPTSTALSSKPTSSQWPPKLFKEAVKGLEALHGALGKSGNQSFENEFHRQYPGFVFVSSTVHRTVKFYINNKHLVPLFAGTTWAEFRVFATSTDSAELTRSQSKFYLSLR